MPKVVSSYLSNRESRFEAMKTARIIQKELMEGYFKDFAKHSGKINSLHIVSVLENIPIQLSNNIEGSVKRYRFKKGYLAENYVTQEFLAAGIPKLYSWSERNSEIGFLKVTNYPLYLAGKICAQI